MSDMQSAAWLGKGLRAQRGMLTLNDGRLQFETEAGVVFAAALQALQSPAPHWRAFDAAVDATIDGRQYFLSFVPPSSPLTRWYSGLSAGHRWRAAIEGRPIPQRGPFRARVIVMSLQIARVCLLGCAAILLLGYAADHTMSIGYRLVFGAMGAGMLVLGVLTAWVFVEWLRRAP